MPPLHNALESCRRAATGAAMGLALLAATDAALASAQRTFVASAGNDANPCSIVAPCHSFAAALAQTNTGGEIVALDSAGYAPVDIFGSVSIIAPAGVYAGIHGVLGMGYPHRWIKPPGPVARSYDQCAGWNRRRLCPGSASDIRLEGVTISGFSDAEISMNPGARQRLGHTVQWGRCRGGHR